MAITSIFPAIKPSLNLDFANTKSLDPRITFSRASAATYYDGKTVAKAEENLLTYSQEFGNAVWSKNAASVVDNVVVAPDGSVTADKLVESDTNSAHNIQRAGALTVGKEYVFSIYVKAAGRSYAFFADSAANGISVNLTNGTIATVVGSVSNASAVEAPAGSGWWRVSFAFIAFGTFLNLYAAQDAVWANRFYQGDGTSGIYIWGAQLEQRSQVTAYTPTTTQPITNYIPVLQTAPAGVARFDHNPATGESLGLLIEEQRTNLLTYSEQFDNAVWLKSNLLVESNSCVAPDGSLSADKIVATSVSDIHQLVLTIAKPAAAATYTRTIYAKPREESSFVLVDTDSTNSANVSSCLFTLSGNGSVSGGSTSGTFSNASASIQLLSNGWYRCSMTYTTGSETGLTTRLRLRNVVFAGDGYSGLYIWGAQLEAGAFPTSYIKTEASQVTRAGDNSSMIGANFSSWYRQDEGTVLANASSFSNLTVNYIANANDGTVTNRLALYFTAINPRSLGAANSVSSFQFTGQPSTKSCKTGFAYAVNNFAMSTDGSTPQTDTEGAVPTVNQLNIGTQAGVTQLNGHIRRLAYYPKRLTDAQLQALTT